MTVELKELTAIRTWVNKFSKLSNAAQDLVLVYLMKIIDARGSQPTLPLKDE